MQHHDVSRMTTSRGMVSGMVRGRSMRRVAGLLLVLLLVAVAPDRRAIFGKSAGVQPPRAKPNVVLIVTDDMGYGDIGSYGARDIRTPNLDRLAREGVRLTDAYANGSVCTPTRAALMTGRYQQRVGLEEVLTTATANRDRGLPATGSTLPALLKRGGYATALYGKWHLGYKPEFGPNAHGFDEFFGFLSGAVDYYTHQRLDGEHDLFENTTPAQTPDYLTDAITRRGVHFIERNAGRPFFLELSYNAPHWPFQAPDRPPARRPGEPPKLRQFADDDAPPTREDYALMLERVDAGVGDVLQALERHGLRQDTFVVFTNDNGGEWLSNNAPFFHRKGTLWEGGIRVPLIFRWPGRLPAGRVSPQVAMSMDLMPTILSAAGIDMPSSGLDGIDLLPYLRDGQSTQERRVFWRRPSPSLQGAVREGVWKLLADGGNVFLFDLQADPGERNDLSRQYPEVVRRLSRGLQQWFEEMNVTASKGI